MGFKGAKFHGKVKVKGRPKEVAKAEIMINRDRRSYEAEQRRRKFFNMLDIITIAGFVLAFYSIWVGSYLNALLFFLVGFTPLAYFIVRRILKDKRRKEERQHKSRRR